MTSYARPPIAQETFRDTMGNVIDYGNRWSDMPPETSYSVVENAERFAPLHTIAAALVDHLASEYEVDVDEGYDATDGLANIPPRKDVVRAVRLTPRSPACAPLTFVLTDFPAVALYAGALYATRYPSCGCNACDEIWEHAADELERTTFAVLTGNLTEEVSEPRRAKWSFERGKGLVRGLGQTVSYRIRGDDGSEASGEMGVENVPGPLLETARHLLGELPDGLWQPWTRR